MHDRRRRIVLPRFVHDRASKAIPEAEGPGVPHPRGAHYSDPARPVPRGIGYDRPRAITVRPAAGDHGTTTTVPIMPALSCGWQKYR